MASGGGVVTMLVRFWKGRWGNEDRKERGMGNEG